MILRSIALAGGLAGATAGSQFPEFSQQYVQRLGGAVDALEQVVADFDASARAENLSRTEALAQMQGTAFIERRRADMTRSIARYETLRDDLAALRAKGPFMRAYHASRLTDTDIAQAAWQAYVPAVPISFAGLSFAAAGFVLGAALLAGLARLMVWPLRRRGTA
ncbi:DUF2937 family protein [Sulfitobacter sp. S190]|uniref:DUF2937 family protein n=1 Tax=Sulfitobacter sp. S190 TaxID=2867022 RepID=UPI0021A28EF0|nr:DUF2937 family protein [Sulfitobacter sp. S190]UWR21499.1 DUF2937 family protein [Sulfitobacter sp. S190]